MFAPGTKYERIMGSFALDKSKIFFTQFPSLRWFGCAVLSQRNVGKPKEAFVNHSPAARDLQILLVFYQHPAWFISL